MRNVTITIAPPPPVEATVTLTMPLSEARELRDQLGATAGTRADSTYFALAKALREVGDA